jgi:hypothetical protein
MPSFTHLISSTPGNPVSYNPSMAETFSWVPISNAGRPFYAQATYLTNASDISISTGNISLNITPLETLITATNAKLDTLISKSNQQLGQNGFDILNAGTNYTGNWTTLTVISLSAKFVSLGATSSTTTGISSHELPQTFTMSGPFTSINLSYGSVIAYK